MRVRALPAVVTVLAVAPPAMADVYVPNFADPAYYGRANTTYQEWYGFSSATAPVAPTAFANAAGQPSWTDRTGATDGAFVIGGTPNRLYSNSGTISPRISLTAPAATAAGQTYTFTLQVECDGNGLDPASFLLTAGNGTGLPATSQTYTATPLPGGGFGGNRYDYTVTWAGVPASTTAATPFTVDYATAGASSSQRAARLDSVAAVPEPATVVGIAVGGLVLLGRRRAR